MSKIISDNKIPEVITELENMHPEAACALDHGTRFQLLVAVMLSAQTTDVSVNKVTPALFDKYPTAEAMAKADPLDIQEIIKTIGLYKNKAKNVVGLSKILTENYGGEVPGEYEELVKLPGVGRKTANVVLAEGFGKARIAVDTHVFRVANRIGLADGKDPTEVEETLMARLPEDQWIRAHHLLIFHGRKVCHARKPDCEGCGLKGMCVYFEENHGSAW
ncbi:MAG: endonuclease III [Mogibacterium sp.]|nr:endonuclease III [Mogibacterium sp.]